MSLPPADSSRARSVACPLTSHFRSDETIRSRSVSSVILQGTLDVPQPSTRVRADWDIEIADLGLTLGDIEPLTLARTIMRWREYPACAQALSIWLQSLGVSPELLVSSDIALMACLGTPYHHDAAHYGSAAFCNVFLTEDRGLDFHFPELGVRIPLRRGTVVIFDTAQPHAVIPRSSTGFNLSDFKPEQDYQQVFLTWELPIENAQLQGALQIDFDIDVSGSTAWGEETVCVDGTPVKVCPATGQWQPTD